MSDGRNAIVGVINALEEIRSEWIRSDAKMIHLLSNSMKSSQGGFEKIMASERVAIYRLVPELRRKLIPVASQYLDVSLRDEVRELVNDLDPNDVGPDRYGETRERWRHTWDALYYDSRYEDLIPLLIQAASIAKRTQRINTNRQAGEDRISPHEVTAFHSNPKVIRSGCYDIANLLPMIRDDWQEGDAIEAEWRLKGWSTIGDHFLSEKRGSRYEVDRLLNKIVSDIGPVVFPHLDASLRSRLIQFCQSARPYETTNVHGDRGERWHLCWHELHLDDEVAMLGLELRAVGDAIGLTEIDREVDSSSQTQGRSVEVIQTDLDSNRQTKKPNGWTASELRNECIAQDLGMSEESFRKIRIAAGLPPSPSGGRGSNRRYSNTDIRKLAAAAEGGNFRNGDQIRDAWLDLLKQ